MKNHRTNHWWEIQGDCKIIYTQGQGTSGEFKYLASSHPRKQPTQTENNSDSTPQKVQIVRQETPPGLGLDHTYLIKELDGTCVMAHQREASTVTTEVLTQ